MQVGLTGRGGGRVRSFPQFYPSTQRMSAAASPSTDCLWEAFPIPKVASLPIASWVGNFERVEARL